MALGIATKLATALALFVVLQSYFALDIHLSHTQPMIEVQVIVLDNLPHISISSVLKFAGDF